MMKKIDEALNFPNPRLLAALYFGLLSVVGTILINGFLSTIGIDEAVPVFASVLLGMVVASATGAIFGEQIIHCKKPYKTKTFWLGFIMVIASLPVFTLGLVFFMKETESLFTFTKLHSLVLFYFIALAYSYFLFGILLAVASGLAAMYLRGRLVYDILHAQRERHHRQHTKAKHKIGKHHKLHTSHR